MYGSRLPDRALRVLVAVARASSATRAAGRLGITPSAVSHVLADLERELGVPIFDDRRRSHLNDTGSRLVERLEPAFQAIDAAITEARAPRTAIRLSTLSSFATLWLIPRLPRLRARLPTVDILISTDTRPVDLAVEPYDCVIRWVSGQADWRGLDHVVLFREELVQVASPRLVDTVGTLPRLSARSRPDDWPVFSGSVPSLPPASSAMVFETRGQMIEAAIAGLGVAVIDRHLVETAIAAGYLAQIGRSESQTAQVYAFAARPGALENPALRVFRRWLLEEAGLPP